MTKRLFFSLCIFFISVDMLAQKSITNQNLIWYGYFQTLQFSPKWYWQTEIQERHFVNPSTQHQFIVRGHLHKILGNSGWETSIGMCLFLQNPNDPKAVNKLTVPELRPHIEFAKKQKFKFLTLDHRYKLEARFFHNTNAAKTDLENGYNFGNYRFRYRLQASILAWQIDETRALKLKVSDEIHLNMGSKIVKNVFDQNRIYAGLSIDILPDLTFDVGYLNWFQQSAIGNFFNRDILRLTVFHKIKLY